MKQLRLSLASDHRGLAISASVRNNTETLLRRLPWNQELVFQKKVTGPNHGVNNPYPILLRISSGGHISRMQSGFHEERREGHPEL